MKPVQVSSTFKNRLLARVPAAEMSRLGPHLSPVTFRQSQILHDALQPVDTVYFIEEGLCSIVAVMENGSSVEVGIIGCEGFVGIPAILSAGSSPNRSIVQIAGHGYAINAETLRRQCSEGASELHASLLRAAYGLLTQTEQTAACNRLHDVEKRLARWLLMCHARVQTNRLAITHELLAVMLGTRRSTVSIAAGKLHKAGLIEYSRGYVAIQNRGGLEAAACECYSTLMNEYGRLGLL